MTTDTPAAPATGQLSDHELLTEIHRAARSERGATTHLIALLMELDSRRLYLREGYSSMFTYCTQALHLSEHAAYNRIETARVAKRFPMILELFEQGEVTLTAIRLLAPHLSPDNHRDVLNQARHKSKRDVERLVASLHPQPDVPPVIRKLPARPETTGSALPQPQPTVAAVTQTCVASVVVPARPIAPAPAPPAVKPLAPERYKIQFTANREMYDKLRRAQDLLRHTVPNGDPAEIFDRALTLLIGQLERRKTGDTEHPRRSRVARPNTRYIPAAVKRAVWKRDGGRCTFIGTDGRCAESGFLEYHHVVPFADGGETVPENLQLRCRAHNLHEADEYFGRTLWARERGIMYARDINSVRNENESG